MSKVAVYIDGFNLFYGLRAVNEKLNRCLYWLDLNALADRLRVENPLAAKGDHVVLIKYFSAPVSGNPEKERRQAKYFAALDASGIPPILGYYQTKKVRCSVPRCHGVWMDWEEKQTDVNIAVSALIDAVDNLYDKAIIVSSDSDLEAAHLEINSRFGKAKKTIAAFPPLRPGSGHLKSAAAATMNIKNGWVQDCQFPDPVVRADGYEIICPTDWV